MRSTRPKTSFGADVLKLASGTAIAQALAILATPILTRLYAPEAFGLVALFTSITSILGVLACMRYELSIMLPERDEEACNLLGVSLAFSVLIALLAGAAVWWGGGVALRWLNAPQLTPYLWLVPAMVFLHGVFLALNYWNSRTKQFGRLSVARVTTSVGTVAAKLGVGYAGYPTGGTLIGATVGGQALATCILGGQIWRDDGRLFLRSICLRGIFSGLTRYRKFPLYSTWSALLNAVSVQLPALLLAAFFSPVVVGLYALGHRMLSMPMRLIGGAIAQVFYQRASVAMAEGTIAAVVEKTFLALLCFAVFPFILLLVIAPDLFQLAFGQRWVEAGTYMQILAPWLFFVFLGSPISTLPIVLEKQEVGLLFDIALISSRLISLIIGGMFGNILLALSLYSMSGAVLWACFCGYLVGYAGMKPLVFVSMICRRGLLAMLFVAPTMIVKWVVNASPVMVTLSGLFSAVAYYGYVVRNDPMLWAIAAGSIGKRK